VQSSDAVPLLCAIGAEVTLLSTSGERRVSLDSMYRDDGIDYTTKHRGELLTRVHLPKLGDWTSAYRKLRRRGSIDFPILGVGACLHRDGATIAEARVRIGGIGSQAIHATATEDALRGQVPTPGLLRAAAQLSYKPARTMDNTDSEVLYRKKMTPIYVRRALEDCLGMVAGPA
jgi:4-hydroxybenzoyl-CoA reductase subunit beta